MITLEKYKSYFKYDNGNYVRNSPPCINCTEENFKECLKIDEGCNEFNEVAIKRGWQKPIEGFDY